MPRFYLITLDTCGHCHTFLDNIWPKLMPVLIEHGFEVHHHDVTYSKQRQWNINNPHISPHVQWYPSLLIVNDTKDVYCYEDDMEDLLSIENWAYQHMSDSI